MTKTYTNANGITFDLHDFGPDGQYMRRCATYKPFPGKLGETFMVVYCTRTLKELKTKMEGYRNG